MSPTKCPCYSGKLFSACCQPILESGDAPTALALMRSRYTAYHQGNPEYILNSTHPRTRSEYSTEAIQHMCVSNTWTKLEVQSTEHGSKSDERGVVEFKAHFIDSSGNKQTHHERSTFLKDDGKWFFLQGVLDPTEVDLMKKVSRNDPCPCGSGKKHKKCCGN